jgi:hypothetical protein
MHGMGCMRCLAAAALQHQLQVTLAYPINMPEEPWLASLAQLDAEQLFAVALVLVVMVGYVRARRLGMPISPLHLHLSAAAGCGKTTVLNVTE